VTSRVLGNEHRSVYHYTEPPDATPENTLVWMLKLEPGSTRTLEYDFDADIKDVEGENGFEQGGETIVAHAPGKGGGLDRPSGERPTEVSSPTQRGLVTGGRRDTDVVVA